jgi:conjugative transfer signal peptidase TraF
MIALKRLYPLIFSIMFIVLVGFLVNNIKKLGYSMIYSATASMPRGFYLIVPIYNIKRYDIVEFKPPQAALLFAQKRKWIPASGLMIKYIFAIPGDTVCVRNNVVLINHKKIGRVYDSYADGRPLPQIHICNKLNLGQYFVMSTKSERSFDSRYFGVITLNNILGIVLPIKHK